MATGRAEMFFCSWSTFQARPSVTAPLRMGGVSKSRSRTWVYILVIRLGGWKPNRSSTIWVSSETWPRQAASYSRSPRALRRAA